MSQRGRQRLAEIAAPLIAGALFLAAWQAVVQWQGIPPYILPSPVAIAALSSVGTVS